MPAYFRLDGELSSLLVSNHAHIPAIAWLGDRLEADLDGPMLANHDNAAHAFANLDERAPLDLFPQLSTGYLGSPALIGYRQNTVMATCFNTKQIEQSGQTLSVVLEDVNSELEVTQRMTLDKNSDVVTLSTSLKNLGTSDYHVDWLASATGPNLICSSETLSVDHGDALFVHLGWSGNYSFRVEQLMDGNTYLQCGVLLNPGEQVVAPGAVLQCPVAYFTLGQGLNQCTQRFHRFARQHILPNWTRTPRPIHANSWEAMYFDLNDDDLKALVDAAAKIGAERFILDVSKWTHAIGCPCSLT